MATQIHRLLIIQCVLPSGCSNNNPPCDSGFECINNQCVKKCNKGQICEGNYVYYQNEDCSRQTLKFCQWGCNNFGDCSAAPPGCQYNNPACPSNYQCVNNQCVEQKPTGCAYSNPPCSSGYICSNNQCIQNQQACNSECNNLLQQWCNGNVVMGCYKVNNCPKILQMEACIGDKSCVNGQCVVQQKLGCAYYNPDCSFGYECINNACVKEQQIVTCEQGWKCKDYNNKAFQYNDCSFSNSEYCNYGCENGYCKGCQVDWKCSEWSKCANNQQTRTCTDLNNCGESTVKPFEKQSCQIVEARTISEPANFATDDYPIIFVHGHFVQEGIKAFLAVPIIASIPADPLFPKGQENVYLEFEKCLHESYPVNKIVEPNNDKSICNKGGWETKTTVRMSYYIDEKGYTDVLSHISTYSRRLAKVVDLTLYCTGSSKVNIISNSMGGLVSRKFMQSDEGYKINKLIMLGTPNLGIYGDIKRFCGLGGHSLDSSLAPECEDMNYESEFLKELNLNQNINKIKDKVFIIAGNGYKGIATNIVNYNPCLNSDELHDGVVCLKSAILNGQFRNSQVNCYHTDLQNPNKCPDAYKIVLEALRPSSNVKETLSVEELKLIEKSTNKVQQQTPTITSSSNTQKSTQKPQEQQIARTEGPTPQTKPQTEEPKQPEPEKEQKKEEPKSFVLVIKSWFSRWFE